jgi:hypothetical protein
MAVVTIMDLVSRKWLTEIVSVEETSVQVAQAFTDALRLEGLDEVVVAYQDALVDPSVDDPSHPILLVVSDNGPQMASASTRAFMALNAIGQHFAPTRHPDRPGLDRDPVRAPQGRMTAPARDPRPSRAARRTDRRAGALQHDQTARRHRLRHTRRRTRRPRTSDPQSPPNRTGKRPTTTPCLPPQNPPRSTHPRTRRCCLTPAGSVSLTQKRLNLQAADAPEKQTAHRETPAGSHPQTPGTNQVQGSPPHTLVELRGLEPLTPCMPCRCATSCATAPNEARVYPEQRRLRAAAPDAGGTLAGQRSSASGASGRDPALYSTSRNPVPLRSITDHAQLLSTPRAVQCSGGSPSSLPMPTRADPPCVTTTNVPPSRTATR